LGQQVEGSRVALVGFQKAAHGADAWQLAALAPPMAVEDLQRDARVVLDLAEEPQAGWRADGAARARVGADGLAGEAGVAALGVGIPPGFQGADRVGVAIGSGPRARGGVAQALGERNALLAEALEMADSVLSLKRLYNYATFRFLRLVQPGLTSSSRFRHF
jgi:hypothetical protein